MLDSSPVSEFNCFSQLGLDSTVPAWVAEPTPVDSGLSQPSTSLYSFMGDIKGMFIELVTRVSHIELRQEATKQFLGTLASGKHEDAVPVEQAGVTGAQQYQSCFSFGYVRSIITLHHPLQCLLGGPSNSLSMLTATSGLQVLAGHPLPSTSALALQNYKVSYNLDAFCIAGASGSAHGYQQIAIQTIPS